VGIHWNSVGIPTGFSVGMGWVWGLKSNPHGSPVKFGVTVTPNNASVYRANDAVMPQCPSVCPSITLRSLLGAVITFVGIVIRL